MRTASRPFLIFGIVGLLSLLSPVMALAAVPSPEVAVQRLRVEYQENPIGIGTIHPRFSWILQAAERGVVQSAYQLRVAASESNLHHGHGLVWDSGKVASDLSVHVPYAGPKPGSGERYYWQVRVWDGRGRVSAWSAPAFWEMGLLDASDWTASWITPDDNGDRSAPQPAPMLRGVFSVQGAVRSARIHATSLGLYALEINGRPVGDHVLTPGWTSYRRRLQYQTYDVASLLKPGNNAVGAILGDGWYRGHIGFQGQRNFYGDRLALLAQLVIKYADGRTQVFGTDGSWKAGTGPILMSDIYLGETYDARREAPAWSSPAFDASSWNVVRVMEHTKAIIVAPVGPPVRRIQEVRPVALLKTPAGETVLDFGQNMVGWVRLRVKGPAGTTVTLRHAEVLDKDGTFYTANLRAARQTVRYTLKGGGPETYEPRFTFMGFRYVAVDGYPGEVTADALTGVVVHSDMARTGHLETSVPLINQLQHNIVWSQKGNFVDVPTDCPQRDERLGWTGDALAFSRTAAFNYDVAGFFSKWLADLSSDQYDSGSVPHVIPNVLARDGSGAAGSAAWADASVVIPWNMYLVYGDNRLLERQFPGMKAWVDYVKADAGDDLVWSEGEHFGDWLAFAPNRSDYPGATTGKDLIATAYFAHSADLVARAAEVLGRNAEARKYRELSESVKAAFQREFVSPNGRVGEDTQTAYSLALAFDLLPEAQRATAARRLADDVRRFGHLTTGFVGTPLLMSSLTRYGYLDVAYELLKRDRYPSWLYPVTRGATTIWERWDGIRPDGSFQEPGMNSFNHYALGAIGEWMVQSAAGIDLDPDRPGYKHILIRPNPGGGVTKFSARYESMFGPVESTWEIVGDTMRLTVEIPANTTGTVRLPGARVESVQEGGGPVTTAAGIVSSWQDGSGVALEVGSGRYQFVFPVPPPPRR